MFVPAPHIEHVKYAIRNISRAAAEVEAKGARVLRCNVGDPLKFDFATPPHMVEAVSKAMRDGHNGYAPSAGIGDARAAVAEDARARGLSKVSTDDVMITAGSSEAIDLILTASLEPGDEVMLPCPGYPLYDAIAARLQAKVVPYYPDEARGWQLDAAAIEAVVTPRTRVIVLCNPNNPTGAVYSADTVRAVLEVARKHRLLVLSDEIYDRLLFEGRHVPTGTLANDVAMVTVSGLAKAYLCPGWRVGWLMFNNPELTRELAIAVQRLADARLCGPGPVQFAVRPALQGPQGHIAEMMGKLKARRALMMQKLGGIKGVSCVQPQGAFYAMPRLALPGLLSDEEFVLRLLREKHVLFVHGSGFGQRPGTHHLRIVFLPPEDVLGPAIDRLGELVREWR